MDFLSLTCSVFTYLTDLFHVCCVWALYHLCSKFCLVLTPLLKMLLMKINKLSNIFLCFASVLVSGIIRKYLGMCETLSAFFSSVYKNVIISNKSFHLYFNCSHFAQKVKKSCDYCWEVSIIFLVWVRTSLFPACSMITESESKINCWPWGL